MSMSIREMERPVFADQDAFREAVTLPCAPVVLRDACRSWPAVEAGRTSATSLLAYVERFATDRPAELFVGEAAIGGRYFYGDSPEGFNFKRNVMSLAQALRPIEDFANAPESGTAYMGSLPADQYAPGFAVENALSFMPATAKPRLWIGNASNVSCHYDNFDNLACVVAGRRRFTLFPPDAIADLYVGPIDHTMAGPPVSLAAGTPPGDTRFPRFEAARERALVVELLPGDALYLPKLWWHQVEATDPINLLVNYWWDAFSYGPDAPMTAMMLAMIAIAERPPEERMAWRAFFDHYVFREKGHPLAHLPEERHGLLGPLSKGPYARIRAMVMRALRGD
jgi:hypothetical protein